MAAADAVVAARAQGVDAGALYQRAVQDGRLGRKLGRLAWASRRFYGRQARTWFRLARLSRRAQRVGLAWYNGADGMDTCGRWGLLRALVRPQGWPPA
jgi:hypothetical protein